MPEDQGKNGAIWTAEASVILKKFNWTQIADNDFDIPDINNKERGLDALFKYKNPYNSTHGQSVVIEAKRYLTTSFSKSKLEEWLNTLYDKIKKLRNAQSIKEMFPLIENTTLRNGLIMIWFHDTKNYDYEKFRKNLEGVRFIKNSRGITVPNRFFVLENYNILRLCSVLEIIRDIEREDDFLFYYPSLNKTPSISRNKALNLEYMFSKFILGENWNNNKVKNRIVFYFGNIKYADIERLRNALSKLQFLDENISTTIFYYKKDDDFRKIEPILIQNLFQNIELKFSPMSNHSEIPYWIKNEK